MSDLGTLRMNFIETVQFYFKKLPNMGLVTQVWTEILSGRKSLISSDQMTEFSFHYPVDTELYLRELNQKYDESMKEDLRTIEGNLKAYLQTFLFYCVGSSNRVPLETSLFAAELYLKIILIPSGIGKLYYENSIYNMTLHVVNNCSRKHLGQIDHLIKILDLIFKYVSEQNVPMVILQGTSNMYANIVKYSMSEEDVKKCSDLLALHSLNCLKNLIIVKDHPKELKYIMESMIRCLRSGTCKTVSEGQRKLAVNMTKNFFKYTVFVEIEDRNKLQYFLDSLFGIIGMPDFDYIEDCVDIINSLDEQLYKEFARKIPNILLSKNHKKFYLNLIKIIYFMLKIPPLTNSRKSEVPFAVCLKNIVLHLLDRNEQIQHKTIEVLANICILRNGLVNRIFKVVNETGRLATLEVTSIIKAMIKILKDKHAGNIVRSTNILHILSKIFVSMDMVDEDLSCEALYLICKDGTPFSLRQMLPLLHELYLGMTGKTSIAVKVAVMRILFKMAMHSDASSSVFLEHLYTCIIYTSTVHGITYGPEQYSNILFTDEFDYNLFLAKSSHLITYGDVHEIVVNFKYEEPGYSMVLKSLLDFVNYKEYDFLTDYINHNFEGICCFEATCHLLSAYRRILLNKGVYRADDFPQFIVMHRKLWDSLLQRTCEIKSIKPTFDLIETLRDILDLGDDEVEKDALIVVVSEASYKALHEQEINQGAVMHLTEICVTLERVPNESILIIFENILKDPRTMKVLETSYSDTLIQLISLFGTIAMLEPSKTVAAVELFRRSLHAVDPIVQLTAIKMYYKLAVQKRNDFQEIIQFCFNHVSSRHTILSRMCVVILEELIHNNYILLDSEHFMKFVHRLASYSLTDFMISTLQKRFLLSNKHDVGRFYMNTLVYMSGYTKFNSYPIAINFKDELRIMRNVLDCPNDMIRFLFSSIQIKARFDILREICTVFDTLVAGICRVDDQFFIYFQYALYTFKVMSQKTEFNYRISYYAQVCRAVEKQIFNTESKFNGAGLYDEFNADVRLCTISLLNLLYFIQNEQLLQDYLFPVFDTVICWVDHVKAELIHYVHYEKGKAFDYSLKRLVHFYKANRQRLTYYINNQERDL